MRARSVVASALLAVAVITGVTLTAAVPGAAQLDGDSPLDDLLADDPDTDEGLVPDLDVGTYVAAFDGATDRVSYYWLRTRAPAWLIELAGLNASTESASAIAANVTAFYNDHNTSFERYANARLNASTGRDVVAITWSLDGETATRYLVANGSGANYTNSSMVPNTTRPIDETVALCGLAARASDEELRRFHERFVEPGKDVTRAWAAKRATKYTEDVETSLIATEGSCEVAA